MTPPAATLTVAASREPVPNKVCPGADFGCPGQGTESTAFVKLLILKGNWFTRAGAVTVRYLLSDPRQGHGATVSRRSQ
jgi:hypothetical protein